MLKEAVKRYSFIIPLGLSFYILDFFIRFLNLNINFGSMFALTASFFTLAWVTLFVSIILLLKSKYRKYIYVFLMLVFLIILLVNYTYYNIFNTFFSLKSIALAGEGMNYFGVFFTYLKWPLIITLIMVILFAILSVKWFPNGNNKNDKIFAIIFLCIAIGSYSLGRHFLGEPASVLSWDAWKYKRNVYQEFSDPRKSMQVTGLYEYVVRDIYLSIFDKPKIDENTLNYLDQYFENKEVKNLSVNDMPTAEDDLLKYFENKNVIFVLMESIDSFLVTEDTMPTLYNMMNNGINFVNHYSQVIGGGATYNSEFMCNTGYMTPFNGGSAAYNYVNNSFSYSLANLFKQKGYKEVNEMHLNYGTFYNRKPMSKVLGYNNYYGSYDMGIKREVVVKDTHFMTDEKLKNLILPDEKFLSFIVTYSAHMPYSLDSIECQSAIPESDREEAMKDEEFNCIKAQANNTDDFFDLLIKNLDKKGILDDTVIIGVTDHYAYAFSDKERLYKLKNINDDNLINKVPFFIWGKDIPSFEVDEVNSNLDVLPTIAHLFSLDYDPKYYLGNNIFSSDYDGFVFFGDYSWYDGNVYYKGGRVISGENVDQSYIDDRNKKLSNMLDINKKVLDSNYFSTLSDD